MNHTIGLGGYQGGSVWVESKEEFPIFRREDLAGGKPKIIKVTGGKEVSGKVYDTHDRLLSFHPRLWHQVQPWTGDRWSLTAYTIRETDILSWEQSKLLMSHGFQINSGKRLPFVPSLITGDSDEDLSMYDFVKKKRAEKEMTKVPAAKSSSHKSESKSDAGRSLCPRPQRVLMHRTCLTWMNSLTKLVKRRRLILHLLLHLFLSTNRSFRRERRP